MNSSEDKPAEFAIAEFVDVGHAPALLAEEQILAVTNFLGI